MLRNKKHGLAECRTEVRHYDVDVAIKYTKDLISNCSTRQKHYIPTWETYLDTLNSLRASPIHEKLDNKATKMVS